MFGNIHPHPTQLLDGGAVAWRTNNNNRSTGSDRLDVSKTTAALSEYRMIDRNKIWLVLQSFGLYFHASFTFVFDSDVVTLDLEHVD